MIAVAVGLALGVGLLLIVSSHMWPAAAQDAVRRDPWGGVRSLLAQAGFGRLSPIALIGVSAASGLGAFAFVLAFAPVLVLDVAVAAAAAAAPFAIIAARGRSRRRALRRAWPDGIDHLVAALRAGLSLADAASALGDGGPEPLRPAFARFAADVDATGRVGFALDELKQRLSDPIADRVIETLRLAREVGGSGLPTVLRALAAQLRSDAAVRAEVEARQGWVVGAARLGVAAPWLVLALLAARPEAVEAYNSPLGGVVLLLGFAVTVTAYRLMLALGRLPAERRWFG